MFFFSFFPPPVCLNSDWSGTMNPPFFFKRDPASFFFFFKKMWPCGSLLAYRREELLLVNSSLESFRAVRMNGCLAKGLSLCAEPSEGALCSIVYRAFPILQYACACAWLTEVFAAVRCSFLETFLGGFSFRNAPDRIISQHFSEIPFGVNISPPHLATVAHTAGRNVKRSVSCDNETP